MIAGHQVVHCGTHGLNDASRLVTEHGGARTWILALHEVQVRMTQPGGGDPHQDLVRTGRVDGDVLDGQLTWIGLQHGSSHGVPLRSVGTGLLADDTASPVASHASSGPMHDTLARKATSSTGP